MIWLDDRCVHETEIGTLRIDDNDEDYSATGVVAAAAAAARRGGWWRAAAPPLCGAIVLCVVVWRLGVASKQASKALGTRGNRLHAR